MKRMPAQCVGAAFIAEDHVQGAAEGGSPEQNGLDDCSGDRGDAVQPLGLQG